MGRRFLFAAHKTFALLATQPHMGWRLRLRHPNLGLTRVFRVAGFEKLLILYRPLSDEVDVLRVVHGSRNLQALLGRKGWTEY